MADVAGVISDTAGKASGFLSRIGDLVSSTQIPRQISEVDIGGLFSNPMFIVPFAAFIGWELYKKKFKEIIVIALFIGVWYLSGTHYMQTLIVNGELQIGKILPVMFGGAAVLGIIIYMYFGRS
jgi:hypothetical protein